MCIVQLLISGLGFCGDEKEMKPTITLTWKQCELISNYYRFPTVVFLLTEKNMKLKLNGKRRDYLLDRVATLEERFLRGVE